MVLNLIFIIDFEGNYFDLQCEFQEIFHFISKIQILPLMWLIHQRIHGSAYAQRIQHIAQVGHRFAVHCLRQFLGFQHTFTFVCCSNAYPRFCYFYFQYFLTFPKLQRPKHCVINLLTKPISPLHRTQYLN